MAGMTSEKGLRRWNALLVLLGLAGIFLWLARRPAPLPDQAVRPVTGVPLVPSVPAPIAAAPELPPDLALALPATEALPALPPPVLQFQLPTDNQWLLDSQPDRFFMFVDRYTPAGQIQVWEGGSYGFVRNPRSTEQGTVYTKFHEGMDIAPAARDGKGEPTDEVRAIADGTVAHVTASARTSNYGNYIVVLHEVGKAGVFYSLYAHLRSTGVTVGSAVRRGSPLGMLGHTGDGIDRRRAHVHLEVGMVLSERFDEFYAKTTALANRQGNYHGSNLIGFDVAAFFAANHADARLMPDQFLRQQEVYYKIMVPNQGGELELADRYPWLRQPGPGAASWEISFTGPGVPVAIAPASGTVPFPTVSWVKPFGGYHSWNTRSLLGGSGNTATLSAEGNRFISLVTGEF